MINCKGVTGTARGCWAHGDSWQHKILCRLQIAHKRIFCMILMLYVMQRGVWTMGNPIPVFTYWCSTNASNQGSLLQVVPSFFLHWGQPRIHNSDPPNERLFSNDGSSQVFWGLSLKSRMWINHEADEKLFFIFSAFAPCGQCTPCPTASTAKQLSVPPITHHPLPPLPQNSCA